MYVGFLGTMEEAFDGQWEVIYRQQIKVMSQVTLHYEKYKANILPIFYPIVSMEVVKAKL